MEIVSEAGLVWLRWAAGDHRPTAADAGTYRVTVAVSDGALTVKHTFTLTVRENSAPNIDVPIPDQTLARGQTLQLQVQASDADQDRLKYEILPFTLGSGRGDGPQIDSHGRLTWKTLPDFDLAGADSQTFTLTVRVADLFAGSDHELSEAGAASEAVQSFNVVVTRDSLAPTVDIAFDKSPIAKDGTAVIQVEAADNVAVTVLTLTAIPPDDPNTTIDVPLDFRGQGKLVVDKLGTWTFRAVARDAENNQTTFDKTLDVVADANPPLVRFHSPASGAAVTEPIDVIGTVDDQESDRVEYELYVAPVKGGGSTLLFASGNQEKFNDVLGTLDPTVLENGLYQITLRAWDLDANGARVNESVTTQTIRVDGRLKPGAFTLQFVDLEIPGMGIPLQVSRSYSSLLADRDLDFGHGWKLDFGQPEQEVDYAEGVTSGLGGHRPLLENSRVEITLPDGTVERFTFMPLPGEFNLLGQATFYVPYFQPDRGNSSWLSVPSVPLLKIPTANGNHEYIEVASGASYNPANSFFGGYYELTTREGTRYGIDAQRNDFTWTEDRNGNRVTFTRNGIEHSSGRKVTFVRDAQGRITEIHDPAGGVLHYAYDGGNLVSVTNRAGAETQFAYSGEHRITRVTDALGRDTARVEYDAAGRITRLIDAADVETVNAYDAGLKEQAIRVDGQLVAKRVYDRRGNVIREENAEGGVTLRQYDRYDNLLKEIQVVGQPDTADNGEKNDLTYEYSYDAFGAPLSTKDPRGNRSHLTYDTLGQLKSTTDPLGNATRYAYDERGNLVEALDPTSAKTQFAYDQRGNLLTATNSSNQTLLTNQFDVHGQTIETTSATGQTTTFFYDANGNQIEARRVMRREGPTPVDVTLIDRTSYDAEGRVIATSQWIQEPNQPERMLWETTTEYNPIGQVVRSTDQAGLATETLYDNRGLPIQTRSEARTGGASAATHWLVNRTVYDALGRALVTADTYVVDASCQAAECFPAAGVTGTRTYYDAAGRVVKSERLSGAQLTIDNPLDDVTRAARVVSFGTVVSTTETAYDNLGRTLSSTDTYGIETRYRYSATGEQTETRRQSVGWTLQPGVTEAWIVSRTVYNDRGQSVFQSDPFLVHVLADGTEQIAGEVLGTFTHYDSRGRVAETARLKGVHVAINAAGDTELTNPGTVLSLSETRYNAQGQVARTIAADGQVTDIEYDALGRQTATIGHAVPAASVALPAELLSAIASPATTLVRLRSETVYDEQGRIDYQLANLIQVEDSKGALMSIYSGAALKTDYHYDEHGNRTGTSTFPLPPAGQNPDPAWTVTTSAQYDDHGRLIAETDPLGHTKHFEYDPHGRLTAVVLPTVAHPESGQMVHPRYEYGYDAQGNLELIRDPLLHETRFTFDARGLQLTRTLPLGFGPDGVQGTSDDASLPEGSFRERFEYDDRGHQTLHVSFEGVVTQMIYDDMLAGSTSGQLLEKRFYSSEAAYNNGAGTPAETWTFEYDAFGREAKVTQNDGTATRTVESTYDAQGRLTEVRSAEGVITYRYDSLGRKEQMRVFPAGADPSIATPERVTTYTYDPLGRLKTVVEDLDPASTTDVPLTTVYGYDLVGNLDRTDLPNGVISDYVYDRLYRLSEMTHYQPDAAGPLDPSSLDTDLSDNQPLARFQYTVRADGKRTAATETFWLDSDANPATPPVPHENQINWSYDGVGRLIEESFNHFDDSLDRIESFVYDLAGNRRQKWLNTDPAFDANGTPADTIADELVNSLYDANDRLLQEQTYAAPQPPTAGWTAQQGTLTQTTSYGYDHTQQTSKEVKNAAAQTTSKSLFAYDLQGRLWKATTEEYTSGTLSSRERVTYDYDASGIRVSSLHELDPSLNHQYQPSSRTEFLVDHHNFTGYQQAIKETTYDAQSNVTKTIEYTFGHDEVAQTVTPYIAGNPDTANAATHVFGHDGHGSVRVLFDLAAAIDQLYSFEAYGHLLTIHDGAAQFVSANSADALTSLLYSGEYHDSRIGWDYLRERWMRDGRLNPLDPVLGDLNNPLSLHKYAYVHGDPIQGVDPSGMIAEGLSGLMSQMNTRLRIAGANSQAAFAAARQAGTRIAWAAARSTARSFGQIGEDVFVHTFKAAANALRVPVNVLRGGFRVPGGTRFYDGLLQFGQRFFTFESKVSSISKNAAHFPRVVDQLRQQVQGLSTVANELRATGSTVSEVRHIVWTWRAPNVATLNALKSQLGTTAYGQIQFIHGVEGIVSFLRFIAPFA